ncbi:putative membrane protein [Orbus hercynius]|uniref:Probable lipopolysaccharide assembly protein A n=1 Tax=Orbus hercynius TaxID=593135 RepID=A0A495RJJ8_9GAMM|nr:lipopolysaccharide assembly protein LapA domain-containing protein [Orbus hercynius]RKS87713.1 putative membrane protein [Orbus hercynius]
MKFVILFLVLIVIFAISITLGANNNQPVVFNYLLAQTQLRLSTLLAILFGTGFVLGWLLTGIFFVKVKFKLSSAQRKLRKLQKMYDDEIAARQRTELTTLPLTENK